MRVLSGMKNEENLVKQIKDYIDSNIDQELSREQLAQIVYINIDYMSRLFKKEQRVSLSQYILNKKISAAKEYLCVPGITVSMAAEQVGISNFSYFSKLFKRETGLSPSDYKKKYESEK